MSRFDKVGSLIQQNSRRQLTPLEIEHIVRHHRAVVMGQMIAEAIIWVSRLPKRLLRTWKTARPPKRMPQVQLPRSATP
ncbi:MAG TPA: hypothetical protein VGB82_10870 [Alphaproteobacteria bacterium]